MLSHQASVVVLAHDRLPELRHTLTRMTSLPEQVPITVMDNGSTGGTAAAVRREFPQVRLISCGSNLGAVARNLGVASLATPYVAFCDDDTWWEPGALTRAAAILRDHPRLWRGGEEELSLDLISRGWTMCWAEDVVVHHAPTARRDPRRRRQLGIRNTLWTTWLRRPAPTALRRTANLLRELPRDRATLAAVAEALRGMPWVLRERRAVPPAVEATLQLMESTQPRSPARRYVG